MARVSIEDCLEHMDNRFALVKVASQRARDLLSGEEVLLRTKNKECVTALREIAEGLVIQEGSTTEDRAESLAYNKYETAGADERLSVAPETAE